MREICKNCEHAKPTYKGIVYEMTGKRVKTTSSCDDWRDKR